MGKAMSSCLCWIFVFAGVHPNRNNRSRSEKMIKGTREGRSFVFVSTSIEIGKSKTLPKDPKRIWISIRQSRG